MSERKSVAQMRASGRVAPATTTHTLCLSSTLADEYRAKREELTEAVGAIETAKEKPGRAGGNPAVREARKRVDDLSEELDTIAEAMAEFEVDVVLSRKTPGEWNLWAEVHPPREKDPDEQGRRALVLRDATHGGRCDFDALVADLGDWVDTLNGEPATGEDWAFVADNASPADVDDVADAVLALHEARVTAPKSLKPLLGMLLDGSDSASPETGE